jgi:hypothetical protein
MRDIFGDLPPQEIEHSAATRVIRSADACARNSLGASAAARWRKRRRLLARRCGTDQSAGQLRRRSSLAISVRTLSRLIAPASAFSSLRPDRRVSVSSVSSSAPPVRSRSSSTRGSRRQDARARRHTSAPRRRETPNGRADRCDRSTVVQSAAHDNARRRPHGRGLHGARAAVPARPARRRLVPISNGRLAEAGELPDLDAVILDRATRPLVAGIELGWDVYLPGNMDDNRGRQLLHVAGEAALVSERLEQQAEAQTCRTSLCWPGA